MSAKLARPEIAASKLRVPTHTSYFSSFFVLRTDVAFNGQPAEIGCSDSCELNLTCPYFHASGEPSNSARSIPIPVLSANFEDILKKHGVFKVVNFFCNDAPLFQVTFSSEYNLKRFLHNKKRMEIELVSFLSEFMQPSQQDKPTKAPIRTYVCSNLFLMNPEPPPIHCPKPTEVTLDNHTTCMAVWKESEVFEFGEVFQNTRSDEITLNAVLSEIYEVYEWVGLGLHLGMPKFHLNRIGTDHRNDINRTVRCLESMIDVWIDLGKASWSALVKALCAIGRYCLAEKLAVKYGIKLPPAAGDTASAMDSTAEYQLVADITQKSQYFEATTAAVFQAEAKRNKALENNEKVTSSLTEHVLMLEQLAQDKEQLLVQLKEKQDGIQTLEGMWRNHKKVQGLMDILKHDTQVLQEQLEQKERQMATISAEAECFRAQLEETSAELASASSELSRLNAQQESMRIDLEKNRVELEQMQYKTVFKDDFIKELKGDLIELRKVSYIKEREIGALEQQLSTKSEEVEKLRKAKKEASAGVLTASELNMKLETAEQSRQEAERKLGEMHNQLQKLEDKHKQSYERKHDECAKKIQRVWHRYKRYQYLRLNASDILHKKKERKRLSINRNFVGDYLGFSDNLQLRSLIAKIEQSGIVDFAQNDVAIYDRRFKAIYFSLLLSTTNVYLVGEEKIKAGPAKGQILFFIERQIPIDRIAGVSISPYQDDFVVLHVRDEYDTVMETVLKTEFLTLLSEKFTALTKATLPFTFSNNLTYLVKKEGFGGGGSRTLSFHQGQGEVPLLKSSGRTLNVTIGPGLPSNTRPSRLTRQSRKPNTSNWTSFLPPFHRPIWVTQTEREDGGNPGPKKPSRAPKPKLSPYQACYDYVATDTDEISFNKGDIIDVLREDSSGWWMGRINGKRGFFPSNYVEKVTQTEREDGENPGPKKPSPAPKSNLFLYKACYDYEATDTDEISFKEGDVIDVLREDTDPSGWWTGCINGKKGLFPSNYVEKYYVRIF